MDDLNARINFLEDEIRKCKNMSSAASDLSSALSRIREKFIKCSRYLSSGGFTIDGIGADAYSFGGYKEYTEQSITPVINNLDFITGTLSTALIRYDKELTDCINERNRLKRLEDKEMEEKNNEDIKPKPMPRILSE